VVNVFYIYAPINFLVVTGIDLSKVWGKPKYWGEKVVTTDECMGISQLLGGTCTQTAPSKSMPMLITNKTTDPGN